MKTPDEIKKGLRHCSEDGCKGCNYKSDCDMADGFSVLAYDALAYIQQLEEREWELFDLLSSVWHGKQYYFKQEDGSVYGRESCQYLTFDQAIDEFAHSLTVAPENNEFQYETGFVKGFESAQPKWISVEERLPKNGQWVLTYCGGYANWFELNKWCGDSWLKIMPVTHWLPLPEPPREDEGKIPTDRTFRWKMIEQV